MDASAALAFIASQRWTFAKTMPDNPHYYIVRRRGNTDEEFDAFVRFLRDNAEERVWGKSDRRRLIYLYWTDPDGRLYWTMGWPVEETTIVNRVEPEDDTSRAFISFPPAVTEGMRYSSPTGRRPE